MRCEHIYLSKIYSVVTKIVITYFCWWMCCRYHHHIIIIIIITSFIITIIQIVIIITITIIFMFIIKLVHIIQSITSLLFVTRKGIQRPTLVFLHCLCLLQSVLPNVLDVTDEMYAGCVDAITPSDKNVQKWLRNRPHWPTVSFDLSCSFILMLNWGFWITIYVLAADADDSSISKLFSWLE